MKKGMLFVLVVAVAVLVFTANPTAQTKAGETETYSVVVDYEMSLAEMIKAGNYDWVNNDITAEHFPVAGNGKAKIVLRFVHFNYTISSNDAIAELDKLGLRPATLPELLAFGAKYPELQRQFPIIALGSVWTIPSGLRRVAALSEDSDGRFLRLSWFEGDWFVQCRFLAVSK